MTGKGTFWTGVVVAVVLVGLGGVILIRGVRQDVRARVGEEIQYDDFGFTVLLSRRAAAVGPEDARVSAAPGEALLIVRLKVENHARRVEYELANHIPRVESAAGAVYEVDEPATRALQLQSQLPDAPRALSPGSLWASDLVFRIPAGATGLRLRLGWHEPMPGFDRTVFGDRTLTLDAP